MPDRIKFLAQEVAATSGSSSGRPSEPIGTQRLPTGDLLRRCGQRIRRCQQRFRYHRTTLLTTKLAFQPIRGKLVLSGGGQLVQDERPAKKGSAQATAQASALKAHTREQPPSWSSKYKHRHNSFLPMYFTIKTMGRKNPKRRKVLESGRGNV